MTLTPSTLKHYHVFLASPGDVNEERQAVRQFFDGYNQTIARVWGVRFEVVDWENYASIGIGRPQELITRQTLDRFKDSLALVIGLMAQRFGSPTGIAGSGTEEEFRWSLDHHRQHGSPEIKWFFKRIERFVAPPDSERLSINGKKCKPFEQNSGQSQFILRSIQTSTISRKSLRMT